LFITTMYPTPELPVGGVFVREHALAAATKCDVGVLHLDRSAGRHGLYEITEVEDDIPTIRLQYRRFPRPLSYAAFLLGTVAAYRRLRRSGFAPNLLHAQSFLSVLPALVLGAVLRKPVVYTEHWTIFLAENPGRLSPPMLRLARFALRHARLVLPVSDDLRNALRDLEPDARFRVVQNVVDERVFHPGPARERTVPRKLLTVGVLETERKGVDLLLEAIARLPADDIQLEIVGDGANRRRYEQLTRDLGIEGVVTFRGAASKDDVAERMRASDLFVLASRYENNPCVVLEALATGLPVVATRVGGVAEIVVAANGELVEPLDPVSIAGGIERALARLDEFDTETIARDAAARWGRGRIGEELDAAYGEAVER
jgi:glycosyltransferase involved in cell wall biosynthesis